MLPRAAAILHHQEITKTMSDLESSIRTTTDVFHALTGIAAAVESAAALLSDALHRGHKVLACGNGGSAAESAHFATELVGRFAKNRRSLPAIALSGDGSLLTCIGNDFGFDQVFARQIAGLAQPGDVLAVFSSSGNSPNLVAGLNQAKEMGIPSISFLGRGGGRCKGLATIDLIIPGDSGAAAQEAHLFLIHHFCRRIDREFDCL